MAGDASTGNVLLTIAAISRSSRGPTGLVFNFRVECSADVDQTSFSSAKIQNGSRARTRRRDAGGCQHMILRDVSAMHLQEAVRNLCALIVCFEMQSCAFTPLLGLRSLFCKCVQKER